MSHLLAPAFPLVLAGPSGSGKTSIARRLTDRREDVRFSVSATTRPPRADEVDGVHYRFVSPERFERLLADGDLLEWAEVHGHRYGTPRSNVARAREAGVHLLLDIDVQGARSVRREVPDAVSVFLLPPTGKQVLDRLRRRRTEDDASLRRRLRGAREELAAVAEFDFVVVNEDLAESSRAVEEILSAERRRVARLGTAAAERAERLADEIERSLS